MILFLFFSNLKIKDGSLPELVRKRYESFDTEIGAQIEVTTFKYFISSLGSKWLRWLMHDNAPSAVW